MKLFLHHRINKCISILEQSAPCGISKETIESLYSSKYRDAMNILESSGYINCTYAWGVANPVSISISRTGFSEYHLGRYDIWINRLLGFISGLALGVLSSLILQWLT